MNARPRPLEPEPEGLHDDDIDPTTGLSRDFVPQTELARVLLEHRKRYIAAGGRLYSREEILRELAEWNDEPHEDLEDKS